MSDDNPFAEPGDTDRTVIRPNPGGRRPAPAPLQPEAAPAPAMPAGDTFGMPAAAQAAPRAGGPTEDGAPVLTGLNRLNATAAPLFALLGRIRNRAQHMDVEKLRRSVVAEVRGFEERALQQGIPAQTVKVARYALCAALDDVVLNTPWGEQSGWAMQSMVGTFHRETVGGDRFYDLLARLEKEPQQNIELLEFLFMCLTLGFEGRLRVEPGGAEKHARIRAGLAGLIRAQRGPVEHDLSPAWAGVNRPAKRLSAWKWVWVAIGTTGLLLLGQFGGFAYALSQRTENLTGRLDALTDGPPVELARRAPPPEPTEPAPVVQAQMEKIAAFLSDEITSGLVAVSEDGNVLKIRIAGSGMFGSASDQIQPEFRDKIARVARALGR